MPSDISSGIFSGRSGNAADGPTVNIIKFRARDGRVSHTKGGFASGKRFEFANPNVTSAFQRCAEDAANRFSAPLGTESPPKRSGRRNDRRTRTRCTRTSHGILRILIVPCETAAFDSIRRYEMHISSEQHPPTTTILTKCAKMSKEGHAFGMNGNVDGNSKEECPRSNYGQGGRLKFFKDGKFILELERAREGERVSWVSVPRKTFWPPQGTASSTPAYRQESSTSLSVSDDNSSIQSSPWQRDHSWKQSNPSRNLSKELRFYFWRPKSRRKTDGHSRGRRRAPNSVSSDNASFVRVKKSNKKLSLLGIVQQLIDKVLRTSTPPRAETVVSPRKRFLREMEKDKSLQEDNSQKRSRSKLQTVQSGPPNNPSTAPDDSKPLKNSSYSITSLLADDRQAKRSPNHSPNHYPAPQGAQYCSPGGPEDRWYSESVDRLRSIELSQQVDKCASFPPYSPQSYLHGYMYPFVPPYYGSGAYGRGYGHPVYPPGHLLRSNETAGYPWAPEARKDEAHREETVTDMPLNLSKNSG